MTTVPGEDPVIQYAYLVAVVLFYQ